MSSLRRRVLRVARTEQIQRRTRDPVPAMLLVSPGQWPPQDEAAYWAAEAAGDHDVMDDLVERHTGEQPSPPQSGQLVVVIREVPGGRGEADPRAAGAARGPAGATTVPGMPGLGRFLRRRG